jgi:hypothetical protein
MRGGRVAARRRAGDGIGGLVAHGALDDGALGEVARVIVQE